MSNNLENDRTAAASKMYPIDLAPQKITIVKSVNNSEMKLAHIVPGQQKTATSSQVLSHPGAVSMMRPASQIISSSVTSQPQMVIRGSPMLQVTQIVSQSSQIVGPNTQIVSQSQLIGPGGQIVSPGTQIISQGTQLSAQLSSGQCNTVVSCQSLSSNVSQTQIVSAAGSLVVNSTVRTLPPGVRVLPPLPQHNKSMANVSLGGNVTGMGNMVVSKPVTSHVPRGPAAGASLAVPRVAARPVAPISQTMSMSSLGGSWSNAGSGSAGGGAGRVVRGAVVYSARAPRPPAPAPAPAHCAAPSAAPTVLTTGASVISGAVRGGARALPPASRPLPLLQRNYQPAKVVGVGMGGAARAPVGNSAPAQLYYEVGRGSGHAHTAPIHSQNSGIQTHSTAIQTHGPPLSARAPRSMTLAPLTGAHHTGNNQVNIVNSIRLSTEDRPSAPTSVGASVLPRPTILRKRDFDGSPTKSVGVGPSSNYGPLSPRREDTMQWEPEPALERQTHSPPPQLSEQALRSIGEQTLRAIGEHRPYADQRYIDQRAEQSLRGMEGNMRALEESLSCLEQLGGGGGGGGSTTESAASSPAPDDELPSPPRAPPPPAHPPLPAHPPPQQQHDVSPRKKPRKQMLSNKMRQCDYPLDEPMNASAPPPVKPMPKRPQLSASYVCGWRATALHFVRPGDVRRRAPSAPAPAPAALLAARHGWKLHHLTAQMDDLVSLESDVGEQLSSILRALESTQGKQFVLKPSLHSLLELVKGNIQRSKIVCEGIQESREDILRVFKHRTAVSDILTRQSEKRALRKHRTQT